MCIRRWRRREPSCRHSSRVRPVTSGSKRIELNADAPSMGWHVTISGDGGAEVTRLSSARPARRWKRATPTHWSDGTLHGVVWAITPAKRCDCARRGDVAARGVDNRIDCHCESHVVREATLTPHQVSNAKAYKPKNVGRHMLRASSRGASGCFWPCYRNGLAMTRTSGQEAVAKRRRAVARRPSFV